MSKKRDRKHQHRYQHQHQHQQRRRTRHLHAVTEQPDQDSPYDQELFQGLRKGLRADHPLDLLAMVSGLLTVTDPRGGDPFSDEEPAVGLEQLVESFVGTDYAETTAALTVIRALTPDDLLSRRLGGVLAGRRQPMPEWVTALGPPTVTRVVEMSHVLGDGEDYFLEARLPSGEVLTAMVYVDHNMGTIVKDAFCIPDTFEAVQGVFDQHVEDPDTTFTEVDPAWARARLEAAIGWAARTLGAPESDTWPASRPLVEWLVRSLPAGGEADWPEPWDEDAQEQLTADFLASSHAAGLDADERDLAGELVWYGAGWTGGDPLRWSPVRVEVVLMDWIPRKIVADVDYLAKAPEVLRRYIGYAHQRQRVRGGLTDETLAAVGSWEPQYRELVRSDRPQGADALVDVLLAEQGRSRAEEFVAEMLARYDRALGGREVLMGLDADPLPDEPFAWEGIPGDVAGHVAEVLELSDSCAQALFDTEHRTAFRRFLARVAAAEPGVFRRRGKAPNAAAAVCWAVAKANHTVSFTSSPVESKQLFAWFGVSASVSQRAGTFLHALGGGRDEGGEVVLGAPDLLVADRRAEMIELRDRWLAED